MPLVIFHTSSHSLQELLVVIKETENDDLTNVMQELIETYADQIGDVAVNLCQELVCSILLINWFKFNSPRFLDLLYYRAF